MAKFFRSVFAGAVGGLVGAYVMNQFQALVSAASTPNSTDKFTSDSGDDATVKTANAISEAFFDRSLTPDEKKWAGPAVHYATGATLGALYGALAEQIPALSAQAGLLYGASAWLGADEIAVPALGLSGPPTETPLSGHAQALAAHLVFGVTAVNVRRIILRD